MKWLLSSFLFSFLFHSYSFAQEYFLATKGPYDPAIPTPESFLGYPIGSHHTRHDQIVNYLQKLAELSDMATIEQYGETYEHRLLIMLRISSTGNLVNLEQIRQRHLNINDPSKSEDFQNLPVFGQPRI